MKPRYKSYSEKLSDPRWQKCRIRALERDNYTCTECGDATTQLQVHHLYYVTGRDPWEYPTFSLKTLCKSCHKHQDHGRGDDGNWNCEEWEFGIGCLLDHGINFAFDFAADLHTTADAIGISQLDLLNKMMAYAGSLKNK